MLHCACPCRYGCAVSLPLQSFFSVSLVELPFKNGLSALAWVLPYAWALECTNIIHRLLLVVTSRWLRLRTSQEWSGLVSWLSRRFHVSTYQAAAVLNSQVLILTFVGSALMIASNHATFLKAWWGRKTLAGYVSLPAAQTGFAVGVFVALGRNSHLTFFQAAGIVLKMVQAGHIAGRAVLLAGPPGTGKVRSAAELAGPIGHSGICTCPRRLPLLWALLKRSAKTHLSQ